MIWETSRNKLNKSSVSKIVPTIHCLNKLFQWSQSFCKFTAIRLKLQFFFSTTRTIFSHSHIRSEIFSKQNTIYKINFEDWSYFCNTLLVATYRFVTLYFDFVTRRQESIEADNKFWMAPKKLWNSGNNPGGIYREKKKMFSAALKHDLFHNTFVLIYLVK